METARFCQFGRFSGIGGETAIGAFLLSSSKGINMASGYLLMKYSPTRQIRMPMILFGVIAS